MSLYGHQASAMMGGVQIRREETADTRTLTERMDMLAQTAQSALDRVHEMQSRVTGIRRDEVKGDRLNSVPCQTPALPHSLQRAESTLSLLHDTLAEIERAL